MSVDHRNLLAAGVAASLLSACATLPEPQTHDEWLARQMEVWNSIRECNPELAMCHRKRDRLNMSGGCFPPEYPFEAKEKRQEGRTRIRIDVEAGGKVSSVTLVTGSGHELLDRAATKGFSNCSFPSHLRPQTASGSHYSIEYVWALKESSGDAYIRRIPN